MLTHREWRWFWQTKTAQPEKIFPLAVAPWQSKSLLLAVLQATESQHIRNQIDAAVANWNARRTTWIADADAYGKRFTNL